MSEFEGVVVVAGTLRIERIDRVFVVRVDVIVFDELVFIVEQRFLIIRFRITGGEIGSRCGRARFGPAALVACGAGHYTRRLLLTAFFARGDDVLAREAVGALGLCARFRDGTRFFARERRDARRGLCVPSRS